MSVSGCALCLIFSTLFTVVSGILRGPTNVHLSSTNLDLVLRWGPPEGAPDNVTYSTEYRSSVTDFNSGCMKISTLECDLTSDNISVYGYYTGRVQAQLGDLRSPWVESKQITLDKDTSIDSPSVSLLASGANLEVSIKDPVFRISTLRNVYSVATYNITYWKKGEEKKPKNITNIQQNRVVLDGLQPQSKYCVQVQIHIARNPNASRPSNIICESTTSEEETPWVAALVVFLVMALALALVVFMVLRWKSISQFLCPKQKPSQHFTEFVLAPPRSSLYLAMQNSLPVEEINHQVDVVPKNLTLEESYTADTAESSCNDQLDVSMGNGLTSHKYFSEETL